MPLAILGIVGELDCGRANRHVMITHSKESADAQDIATDACAAVSNVLDHPDVLMVVVIYVKTDHLRADLVACRNAGKHTAGVLYRIVFVRH